MSASFTPGPWMAAAAPSSVVGWPVVGGMGRSIANVTWLPKDAASVLGGSDADYDAFNKQCRANARLIASAPELYGALTEVVSLLRHDPEASEPPRYRCARALKIARAALAKSGAPA